MPGRARAHHDRPQALGIRRRRPREFPPQHAGGDSAGGRPREPPPVRARGDAGLRGREELMPLFGALDLAEMAARLPAVRDLDTEAWTLPKAEILQLAWEVNDDTQGLLPKAMHPAIPPYATIVVTRYPESPVGTFALAQLRLMGRAGAHPRGYVLAAVASSAAAANALRECWGFPLEVGDITLVRYHDRVIARVKLDAEPVLEAALVDPEPIAGG